MNKLNSLKSLLTTFGSLVSFVFKFNKYKTVVPMIKTMHKNKTILKLSTQSPIQFASPIPISNPGNKVQAGKIGIKLSKAFIIPYFVNLKYILLLVCKIKIRIDIPAAQNVASLRENSYLHFPSFIIFPVPQLHCFGVI